MKLSRIEGALRTTLAFYDAFNSHDVVAIMALMSEDCVVESSGPAPGGAAYVGKAAVTGYWRDFFSESPHAHFEIEDIFGLGRRCVVRWRQAGTGNDNGVRGVDIVQVRDALISEMFSYIKGKT